MNDLREKKEIQIPVRVMKSSLIVNEEFCNLFQKFGEQIDIVLIDEEGDRYPCLLNTKTSHLFEMGVWLRKYKPSADDGIIFILPSPLDLKSIRIALKSRHLSLGELTKKENLLEEKEKMMYLGKELELGYYQKNLLDKKFYLPISDLVRHIFICGVTGAGKTVFGKAIIEEAAFRGIPSIVIDLKGDLSSLALVPDSLCNEEFLPWVEVKKGEDPNKIAALKVEEYKKQFEFFGIPQTDLKEYKKKVAFNVFTFKSNRGLRLCISPFTESPRDILKLKESEADVYTQMIDLLTNNFVMRLGIKNQDKMRKAVGYLFELVKYAIENNINLQGYLGLGNLIGLIENTPKGVARIGARSVDDYISRKERKELANQVNNLLTGASKLWFEGTLFDLDEMLSTSETGQKTSVNIINLSELDLEDRFFVVSYVATAILLWMRRQGGTSEEPRLIFYIDEIGGGGGKQSFFHSTAISPSKPALRQLLMQGRTFGVGCIFATQNPGDVDYKGLSNCGTWVVGKLSTELDRKKIKQGAGVAEIDFNVAERYIPSLQPAELIIKTLKGEWRCFKERWLYSYHSTLSYGQLPKIKEKYEEETSYLFDKAEADFNSGDYKEAMEKYLEIINNCKFFSKNELVRLRIGITYFSMQDYDMAIKVLAGLVSKCYESKIVDKAQLYLKKSKSSRRQ